jgi:hypothetical protein
MMEIERVQKRHPGLKIDFSISTAKHKLTVGKGSYTVDGQTYEMVEDSVYGLNPMDVVQTLFLHLVRKKDTGVSLIVVDEMVGAEIPLTFDNDPEFIHVHNVASVIVPAGAKDFGSAKCLVLQELGPEEKTNG